MCQKMKAQTIKAVTLFPKGNYIGPRFFNKNTLI
jgi:hypothetical protein